jgi:hypothetical protein
MLRLLLFDAGKTIQHKNRICEVVETHQRLRRLLPLVKLVNENLTEATSEPPFWAPRRPADRKQFNLERMWRSRRHRTLPPPVWTGEARPNHATRVKVRSNYPSTAYLIRLVSELGYNGHAAFSSTVHGHLPWLQLIDRRKCGAKNGGTHPEHPYIPVAPNQRTTTGAGYRKEQVTAAIGEHRWDDKHSMAVFEIVYLRRKPFLVAASLGLEVKTVYQYCSRVRADLRARHTPKEGFEKADLRAESLKSFVFSECV